VASELVNILHVSDLHLTRRSAHAKDQDVVLKALFDDIEVMIVDGMKPDLIVFGGDLANDADEESIYFEAFEKFIEPLLQKTRLTGERLIICPGNHDASRTVIRKNSALHREFVAVADTEMMNSKYLEDDYRQLQEDKFKAFSDVYELSEAPRLDMRLGYSVVEIEDLDLVLCVWNTAQTTAGGLSDVEKDDYGKLLVPEHQVMDFCGVVARSRCRTKLLIAHHPLAWLKEENRAVVTRALNGTFAGHFAGHIHLADPRFVKRPQGETLEFQTGALYHGRKKWNGLTLVRHAPADGFYEVSFRRFANDALKFVRAVEIGEDGVFYPSDEARGFWKSRPAVNRAVIAAWVRETLKPAFQAKHEDTLVGKTLSEVFYEQPMQSRLPDFDEGGPIDKDKSQEVSVESIVSGTENYVIFGESNFGKSTLLREITRSLIDRGGDPALVSVPALMDFADIRASGEAVLRAVRESMPKLSDIANLRQMLLHGMVTILIDDVDPADDKRTKLLVDFTRQYPRCRYILTSKVTPAITTGLVANFDKAVSFKEILLLPLRSGGIRQFTQQYVGGSDEAKTLQVSARVIAIMQQNSLPSTPFTVSVLLEVFNSMAKDVLIDEVTLIQRFIEYLLAKEKVTEASRASFDYDDKVDCLSFLAAHMVRAEQYELSFDDLLHVLTSYIDKLGYPHPPRQILDSFVAQKVLKRTELGSYRFYLRAFLEYFIAVAMTKDADIRAFVLNEDRYLSFVNEIEFYSGLNRREPHLLELLATRHERIAQEYRASVGSTVDFDGFDNIVLPGDEDDAREAMTEVREHLAAPPMTEEERDALIDEKLCGSDDNQEAFRPVVEDLGTKLLLSLITYSTTLRNLGHLDKEQKERHLESVLDGWIEYLAYSYAVIDRIVKHRLVKIEGVEYRVMSRSAISDERLTRMLMLHLPTAMSTLIRNYLGSEKMVRQVEFDASVQTSAIRLMMRSFLLADIDASDWLALMNKLRPVISQKSYLARAVIWKLNSILKMRDSPADTEERIVDTIGHLYASQAARTAEDQRKAYTQKVTDLRKMLMVRGLKAKAESAPAVRIKISSDPKNVSDSSL